MVADGQEKRVRPVHQCAGADVSEGWRVDRENASGLFTSVQERM